MRLYDSASVLFERILPIKREVYGPENARTVQTIANLGSMLNDMGRLEEAEPYLLEALELRTRIFGEAELPTTTVLNNLALLRQRQGDLAAAEALWVRATEIRQTRLGPDHPAAVSTLLGVANMRRLQEDWPDAAEAFGEAVGHLRRSGPVHPPDGLRLGAEGARARWGSRGPRGGGPGLGSRGDPYRRFARFVGSATRGSSGHGCFG